jgi:hypothetical protein
MAIRERPIYKAHAVREGDQWAIRFDGVPGVQTRARRQEDVAFIARDGLALALDVPEDSFDLAIYRESSQGVG